MPLPLKYFQKRGREGKGGTGREGREEKGREREGEGEGKKREGNGKGRKGMNGRGIDTFKRWRHFPGVNWNYNIL